MRRLLPFAALLTLTGCTGGADAGLTRQWHVAHDRWQARGITRYAYTVRKAGFLAPQNAGPWRVEVRDGTITVTPLDGASDSADPAIRSVDALLADLGTAIDRGVALSAGYDPTNGFPTSYAVDPLPGAIDDEYGYTVTDFTVLP